MLEAYRFGAAEGPHPVPWTADFHRDAVHIFAESLPSSYQRDVARLFRDAQDALAGQSISSDLAEDWAIVTAYIREAADSIEDWLVSAEAAPSRLDPAPAPKMTGRGVSVIHYDALAGLTTSAGVRRLELAAVTVKHYFEESMPMSLGSSERQVLRRLVAGVPIADVASEFGHSERSMYRALSRIWSKLGVSGRAAGLRKATSEGLID